jgi:hypothetical protein
LETPVRSSGSSSISERFCKEYIVSDTQEKNSSSLAASFESIADYRQRTGKSEEELTMNDYVFLINSALKAAGFFVKYIATTHAHYPNGPAGEMVEGASEPVNGEYSFGLSVRPGHQRKDSRLL